MRPLRDLQRCGRKALVTLTTPKVLTSIKLVKSPIFVHKMSLQEKTPALLMTAHISESTRVNKRRYKKGKKLSAAKHLEQK